MIARVFLAALACTVGQAQDVTKFSALIAAADFTDMEGVVVQGGMGGMQNVGWLDAGDWFSYSLRLPADGLYEVDLRISTPSGRGAYEIVNRNTQESLARIDELSSTGTWQRYETMGHNVVLPKGRVGLEIRVLESGWRLLWISLVLRSNEGVNANSNVRANHDADGWALKVQAIDYSLTSGVVAENNVIGDSKIGFLDPGDYAVYPVTLPDAGEYTLSLNIASPTGGGGFQVVDYDSGEEYSLFESSFPVTGQWTSYTTITQTVILPAGYVRLKFLVTESGFNFGYFYLAFQEHLVTPAVAPVRASARPPARTQVRTPVQAPVKVSSTSPPTCYEKVYATQFCLVWGIKADESSNTITDVDAGDWVAYYVEAPSDGTFQLQLRIYSPRGNGAFELVSMETGDDLSYVDNLPATSSWTTISTVVSLRDGINTVQIRVVQAGWTLHWIRLCQHDPHDCPEPTIAPTRDPTTEPTKAPVKPSSPLCYEKIYATQFCLVRGIKADYSTFSIVDIDAGDWVAYYVEAPSDGMFALQMRIYSPRGSGAFSLLNMDTGDELAYVDNLPSTNSWTTISTIVVLNEGVNTVQVRVAQGGWTMHWIRLCQADPHDCPEPTVTPTKAPTPEPTADPTRKPTREPTPYPTTMPTREPTPDPTRKPTREPTPEPSLEPTKNPTLMPTLPCYDMVYAIEFCLSRGILANTNTKTIGGVDAGDWVAYQLTAPTAGTYQLQLRVASPQGKGAVQVLSLDTGMSLALVDNIPRTRTWTRWTTVSVEVVLDAGMATVQLRVIEAGWTLYWIRLCEHDC